MLRHALEDRLQRPDANRRMIWDDFVVFATNLRGHAEVGTLLTSLSIAKVTERSDQIVSELARQNFVSNKVQSDDFWSIYRLLKKAIHGFANVVSQFIQCIRLGVDSEAKGRRGESTVPRVFQHFKNDFAHRQKTTFARIRRQAVVRPFAGMIQI